MFIYESHWVYRQCKKFAPSAKSLVDVGSDSIDYRQNVQSYISDLYTRFEKDGIDISCLDIEPSSGADKIFDISDPLPKSHQTYDIVLALNLLEHIAIEKLQNAINNLFALAGKAGVVVITVPYNLAKHERPIDNMLRPTPEELRELVGNQCLNTEQWQDSHYREPYISDNTLAPKPIVTGGVFRSF